MTSKYNGIEFLPSWIFVGVRVAYITSARHETPKELYTPQRSRGFLQLYVVGWGGVEGEGAASPRL